MSSFENLHCGIFIGRTVAIVSFFRKTKLENFILLSSEVLEEDRETLPPLMVNAERISILLPRGNFLTTNKKIFQRILDSLKKSGKMKEISLEIKTIEIPSQKGFEQEDVIEVIEKSTRIFSNFVEVINEKNLEDFIFLVACSCLAVLPKGGML